MNLIDKIDNYIKEGISKYGHKYLLGLLELSKDEYIELKEICYKFLKGQNNILLAYKDLVLSIGLVQFAIWEYDGGQFWKEAAEAFKVENLEISEQGKIAVENTIKKYNLYFHIGNIKKAYVTTIIVHSLMCKYYYLKLLEFLNDIYFKDLEEDFIEEEVDYLLKYIKNIFNDHIEQEDISFWVQGSKMTIAKQQLPKGFRISYVKSFEIVSEILKKYVFNIHNINYGNMERFYDEYRFSRWFLENEDNLKRNNIINRKNIISNSRGRKKFTTAKYYFDDNKLILDIPRQIIDFKYLDSDIFIEIYDGEKLINKRELKLIRNRVTVKSLEVSILLENYPKKLKYKITNKDSIIFDSKTNLYRDYLIINENGDEVKCNALTTKSYCILSNKDENIEISDSNIDIEYINDIKKISFNFKEDTLVLINNNYIALNRDKIKTQIDEANKFENVVIKRNNKSFRLFHNNLNIILRCDNNKRLNNYIAEINGCKFSLESIVRNIEKNYIFDGTGDYIYKFSIDNMYLSLFEEVHLIIREKGKTNILIEDNIILLEKLEYKFEKSYYYNEKNAKLKELTIYGFDILGNQEEVYNVNLRLHNKIELNLIRENIIYIIEIEVNVIKFGFDEKLLNQNKISKFWYEDLVDKKLILKSPFNNNTICIKIDNNKYFETGKKKNGLYHFEINEYVNYKFEKKCFNENNSYISITLIGDKEEIYLFDVYLKETINNIDINYFYGNDFNTGFYGNIDFIGKSKLVVEIVSDFDKLSIKSYELNDNFKIVDEGLRLNFGRYKFKVYKEIEDDFFGEVEKELIKEVEFIAGDKFLNELKNKKLKAMYCYCANKESVINNFYIKGFKLTKNEDYPYIGQAFFYKKNKGNYESIEWFFARYNPIRFKVKNISKNINRCILEIVDAKYDGLIYDIERGNIANCEVSNDYSKFDLIDSIKFEIID